MLDIEYRLDIEILYFTRPCLNIIQVQTPTYQTVLYAVQSADLRHVVGEQFLEKELQKNH